MFGIDSAASAALSGLTITGGSGSGGLLNEGMATLTNCTVSGNSSIFGTSDGSVFAEDGGGVFNAGTLTLSNCTISGNLARQGGGLLNSGTATLTNCTVSDNLADGSFGGGNGGPGATQLGNWLAATFPNLYGSLAGKTNAQVAAFYKALFALNGKTAPAGSPRADAQVMATALSVYVTNQSLAGDTAAAYGFRVTAYGLGARGVTLGGNGATLGMSGTVSVSVMDLLLAVDARSKNGLMFDANGSGRIDGLESAYRTITDLVFSLITDAGGI